MKIEARLEVGLERPAPSTAITPTRYLGTLSEERSAAGEFGILKKSSSFLKILSTLFCLRTWSAWCSVFSCFLLNSYFHFLTQIWGISSFPKQKMDSAFEIFHFPTWQPGTCFWNLSNLARDPDWSPPSQTRSLRSKFHHFDHEAIVLNQFRPQSLPNQFCSLWWALQCNLQAAPRSPGCRLNHMSWWSSNSNNND